MAKLIEGFVFQNVWYAPGTEVSGQVEEAASAAGVLEMQPAAAKPAAKKAKG